MKIQNINPYLRFVQIINYNPTNEYFRAVDYHFYFMISDYCTLNIDKTEYALQYGSVVIIPPGMRYKFDAPSKLEIVSINFDYTQNQSLQVKEVHPMRADEFDTNSIIEKVYFTDYQFLNEPTVIAHMGYLSEPINSVINEFTYKKQLYRSAASSIFKNVIINIARNSICDTKGSDIIDKILNFIHCNYSANIDNNMLSNIAGYHPYHLNRLMKQATGTTLRQYLINYRMETAKDYLRNTNYPISKIAEMCGYNNLCNFSSDIKKRTGLTPGDYRIETQHLL